MNWGVINLVGGNIQESFDSDVSSQTSVVVVSDSVRVELGGAAELESSSGMLIG
jgi:hypothetical protein